MSYIIENTYVGDGATVLYSFTFEYINPTDVEVSLDSVITTEWTYANATTIEFNTAPGSSVNVRIYRNTTVDNPKATFFPGSAIRAQDLNDNFEQSLFVVQEASFNNSQSASDSAEALATANTADVKSDQANVQSAAAEASAAQAQADATQAASDAAQAQADATQAASDASLAQISANQANSAVQAASIFTPAPNVAAIPGSPTDQDRVSVLDSTGIASFTPLTGLPVGPAYDSGSFVNLVYQQAQTTWEYVSYGANDPDARYLLDQANTVSSTNIASSAVTTAKIINLGVTTDKLADTSVTTDKLASSSVTTDKIASAAVTPSALDRPYLETAGGVLTGGLTVPSLTNGNNNLPIHRGSIDPSQTQSFSFTGGVSGAWYPFDPIPDWCKHVRYYIYTNLAASASGGDGFYLRYGSASGQALVSGSNNGQLINGLAGVAQWNDPLVLQPDGTVISTYTYVLDLYTVDYANNKIWYTRGNGSVTTQGGAFASQYALGAVVVPSNIDRMGCIHVNTSNYSWVSQTFMTGGPPQTADFGPTPTPI